MCLALGSVPLRASGRICAQFVLICGIAHLPRHACCLALGLRTPPLFGPDESTIVFRPSHHPRFGFDCEGSFAAG